MIEGLAICSKHTCTSLRVTRIVYNVNNFNRFLTGLDFFIICFFSPVLTSRYSKVKLTRLRIARLILQRIQKDGEVRLNSAGQEQACIPSDSAEGSSSASRTSRKSSLVYISDDRFFVLESNSHGFLSPGLDLSSSDSA